MTKLYFLLLLSISVAAAHPLHAQPTFQGEIRYAVKYRSKTASSPLSDIPYYPAKQFRTILKDGNWLQYMDSAKSYVYHYYDRGRNREYWKFRYSDTLYYLPGGESGNDPRDSIISTRLIRHTDTVLGRICDRFVLRTKGMTLTLIFDPQIPVDPAWFAAAKLNYYDIVFGAIRSMYLKMVWETPTFVVTATATTVERRLVLPKELPAIDTTPTAPL